MYDCATTLSVYAGISEGLGAFIFLFSIYLFFDKEWAGLIKGSELYYIAVQF